MSEAFGLGWQMSEIYAPDTPAQPPAEGDLPDLSQLGAADWDQIGLFQLQAGITKLSRSIAAAGLEVPDAQAFAAQLKETADSDRAGALLEFHVTCWRRSPPPTTASARPTASDARSPTRPGTNRTTASSFRATA